MNKVQESRRKLFQRNSEDEDDDVDNGKHKCNVKKRIIFSLHNDEMVVV